MKEKLLVLAKAAPAPSKKYEELICVAGITEKGEWRIGPGTGRQRGSGMEGRGRGTGWRFKNHRRKTPLGED